MVVIPFKDPGLSTCLTGFFLHSASIVDRIACFRSKSCRYACGRSFSGSGWEAESESEYFRENVDDDAGFGVHEYDASCDRNTFLDFG